MKRSYLERFFLLFVLFAILVYCPAPFLSPIYAENGATNITDNDTRTELFQWLNDVRKRKSLFKLVENPILENVATKYAKELGKRGYISHIDKRGNRAIQRYRDAGGTATRIGEIIGAGKNLASIEVQWLNSNEHNKVIMDPLWNNVGIGVDSKNHVYIVLFTKLFTKNLQIKAKDRNYFLITGYYDNYKKLFTSATSDNPKSPILIAGLKKYQPETWNPATGYFSFKLKKKDYSFCRLAIVGNGSLIFTDILPKDPKLLMHRIQKGDM